jgi:hypothetical protein
MTDSYPAELPEIATVVDAVLPVNVRTSTPWELLIPVARLVVVGDPVYEAVGVCVHACKCAMHSSPFAPVRVTVALNGLTSAELPDEINGLVRSTPEYQRM